MQDGRDLLNGKSKINIMAKLNATVTDKLKDKFKFIKGNPYVQLLISERNWINGKRNLRKYDDEAYIKKLFKKAFGYSLDLKNPQTFNEKLQWLKLYYRNSLMAVCADKSEVRKYLTEIGYGSLLNEVYGIYEKFEDIDFDLLPNQFVLKVSHGSGWNIVCKNKSDILWKGWSNVVASWLKQNLYVYGREWVYKDMKPRILCEKFLEIEKGELFDYKFFCLNGRVEFIQVTDNDPKTSRINLYDVEWNLMKEKYAFVGSPKQIPRPSNLLKMIEIAKTLSNPFPFARIDLYDVNGNVVFGEITFFPSSGFKGFEPKEYDLVLGNKLIMPNITKHIS